MTDCWRTASHNIINITGYGDRPCASIENTFTQCCRQEDECLQDGICRFRRESEGNTSGFYVGGCTDESGKDPTCLQSCSTFFLYSLRFMLHGRCRLTKTLQMAIRYQIFAMSTQTRYGIVVGRTMTEVPIAALQPTRPSKLPRQEH